MESSQAEVIDISKLVHLLVDLEVIDQASDLATSFPPINQEQNLIPDASLDDVRVPRNQSAEANVIADLPVEATPFQPLIQSEFIPPTDSDRAPPDSDLAFIAKYLPEILTGLHLSQIQNAVDDTDQKVGHLAHQLNDPDALIKRLQPWIAETLRRRGEEAEEEVAIALSTSIGSALKKQVEIESDRVVDALYPIIGSTIAKYMAETLRVINAKIENTLSVEGITRKIRAKLQGVSEAELILKQAMSFAVQAIFLIHKASGLVIAEVQRDDQHRLESDMIAGMLTAIRSFAGECIRSATSELNEIDYGASKIVLEVAGYCYLAIVVQGEPPHGVIEQIRQTLSSLTRLHGKSLETFDGDPDTIPAAVQTTLVTLQNTVSPVLNPVGQKSGPKLSPLLWLSLGLFSAIALPWSIFTYFSHRDQQAVTAALSALTATPELSVYRFAAEANHAKLKLSGRVPNDWLRQKAAAIAQTAVPGWSVDNAIIAVDLPADPVRAAAEVRRVVTVLNQVEGTAITARYQTGKVDVQGTTPLSKTVGSITQAFAQIPGVQAVASAVQVTPLQLDMRFYFAPGRTDLQPADVAGKVPVVQTFLSQHPQQSVRIIGHSSPSGNAIANRTIALDRAQSVQTALIHRGINPARLPLTARDDLPPGVSSNHPSWLSQCVRLEVFTPTPNAQLP